jgi:hypothetical protein
LSAEDTASCTITDPVSGQIWSSMPCKTSSGTDGRGSAAGRRCITASISVPVRALILPRYPLPDSTTTNEPPTRSSGPFVDSFHQQFAEIRQLAPPQQAVAVASVLAIAVKSLDGDRAIVLVFLDQQAHQGGEGKPLLASRQSSTAQRVDGRRKIGRRGAILIGAMINTGEGP